MINNALDTYKKLTKKDLLAHPLAARLKLASKPAISPVPILANPGSYTDGTPPPDPSANHNTVFL
jgi:hypothetical protein